MGNLADHIICLDPRCECPRSPKDHGRRVVSPPDVTGRIDGTLTEEGASAIRQFITGATRDTEEGKYDYEGFLSPLVLKRFAEYMHKHREQSDGKLRSADNWQKGIPKDAYFKSLWRHFVDVWLIHRGRADLAREDADLEEALCACLFNIQGYLFEVLNGR